MHDQTRSALIASLRDRISKIAGAAEPRLPTPGHTGPDALPNPAPGAMHEIFVDTGADSGAGFGFALARARALLSPERPALLLLQLAHEGRALGLPYAPGLAGAGLPPERLVLVRAKTLTELLWAAEEALSSRALAAVIAELSGRPRLFDFTAGRRLGLRAAATGTGLFLLRYGRWREPSAARWRWRLRPAPSAPLAFDPRAPGAPLWRARLEKGASLSPHAAEWLTGPERAAPAPPAAPDRAEKLRRHG